LTTTIYVCYIVEAKKVDQRQFSFSEYLFTEISIKMKPQDFNVPKQHPFGMLTGLGLSNTSECESMLVYLLSKSIEQGSWDAVTTTHKLPKLVQAELVEEIGERQYKLTIKSKGLLYSHYGKE
jgi:hypothetical protein